MGQGRCAVVGEVGMVIAHQPMDGLASRRALDSCWCSSVHAFGGSLSNPDKVASPATPDPPHSPPPKPKQMPPAAPATPDAGAASSSSMGGVSY